MPPRQSNNPKRRMMPSEALNPEEQKSLLAKARYVGSANHKRFPGDYGFHPPSNPRPSKSLCDDRRSVLLPEAQQLFALGIGKSMVSSYCDGDLPKYVWSVDGDGEAYEAKLGNGGYHGYRLDEGNEQGMRNYVLQEWRRR